MTEPRSFVELAFAAVSACGQVAYRGKLQQTNLWLDQAVIMVSMLIGRAGPLTPAFTLATPRGAYIRCPAGQVNIGWPERRQASVFNRAAPALQRYFRPDFPSPKQWSGSVPHSLHHAVPCRRA